MKMLPMYPLANNGGHPAVFWSIQGEAHLRGFQMAFLRLAGCDVNCPGCDTDYSTGEKLSVADIVSRLEGVTPTNRDRWVWVTGGEPTIHNLRPLLAGLSRAGFSTALATAGHRRMVPPVDWLSVSPHDPAKWVQTYGNEVKIVPGLNGFDIDDFLKAHPDSETDFMYRYVQPLWDTEKDTEDEDSLRACLQFLRCNPNWSLSRQDHKIWFGENHEWEAK